MTTAATGDFDPAFERDYNPTARFEEEAARRAALGAAVLARVTPQTLAYGPSPRAKLDLFRPARPNGAVALYFHGGYWRSGSREESAFVAGPLMDAGITTFVAGYDLCPTVTLHDILAQARAARDFVLASAAELQLDVTRFLLMGSSAGAHLSAMMMLDGPAAWPAPPYAALVTGVFELAPVLKISVNALIRLTAADVPALSPLRRTEPIFAAAAVVAVGAEEPEPWKAGVRAYARLLERAAPVTLLECDGEHHFSMSTALGLADHPLTRAVLGLIEART